MNDAATCICPLAYLVNTCMYMHVHAQLLKCLHYCTSHTTSHLIDVEVVTGVYML